MKPRHLGLIAGSTVRYALRSGSGVVYAVLTVLFFLGVASAASSMVNSAVKFFPATTTQGENVDAQKTIEGLVEMYSSEVATVVRAVEPVPRGKPEIREFVVYLLKDRPAVLSLSIAVLLFCLPLLISIGAFSQISGDVEYRGLRYLLLRTTRRDLFFGRFLGTTLFSLIVVGASAVTVIIFTGLEYQMYSWGELIRWGLRCGVAVLAVTPAYVAFCLSVSAAVDSPFGSLVACKLGLIAIPVIAYSARAAWEPCGYLLYVLPLGVSLDLLRPGGIPLVVGVVVCAVQTAAFLWIGQRLFARRDV